MRISIERVKSDGYSVIDNTIAKDKRVSLKSRGLWLTIMSLPPDWDFSIRGLATILPNGRDSIYNCLDELCQFGYCVKKQVRSKGQFKGYTYTFTERPTGSPFPEKPDTEKPDTENPPQSNTHLSNASIMPEHTTHAKAEALAHEKDDPDLDELFDDWAFGVEDLLPVQPVLLPSFLPRIKRPSTATLEPVSKAYHYALYRLCYRAEDEKEVLLLNSSQRGRVAGILGELRDAGADLNKIHVFEAWWSQNWRSRDKASKQYQSPRPEQVHEHWLEAMKANIVPKTHTHVPEKAKEYVSNLQQAMEMRAKQRNNK